MFGLIVHGPRLLHAARVLSQYDVLIPEEYRSRIPALARLGMRIVALGARPKRGGGSERIGERLAAAFQDLGPSYIKMGQFIATRPDIVGSELAADLQLLQDKLPPFAMNLARDSIERELGRPVHEIYDHLDPPVAAASVAQVHPAQVIGGEKAAVKILRPNIESLLSRDVDAFAWAARWAERLKPDLRRLSPTSVVATLQESLQSELDLRLEAAAQSEMAEYAGGVIDGFRVPGVDWERTSKRVLTTEWIEGTPLTDKETLIAKGFDLKDFGAQVLTGFLEQALFTGLFHADLHAGNLIVDPDGGIVAVDYGIVGRLDRESQRYLAEILYGFITRNYVRLAEVHFEAGYVPADQSQSMFAQALRSIGEPIFGQDSSDFSMARVLEQLLDVTGQFNMHLQPQLVLLQKTMVVAEGVARECDPTINIWNLAEPIVERWMQERLGPAAVLDDVARGAATLGRALNELPQNVEEITAASRVLAEEGRRLRSPSSVNRERTNIAQTIALWIGAVALAVLALASLS